METSKQKVSFLVMPILPTYIEIVNLLSEAHSLARMPLTNRFPTIKTFSCTLYITVVEPTCCQNPNTSKFCNQ